MSGAILDPKALAELLPDYLDYDSIFGLRNEAREKLARARPRSIGQAARIPGITPAAVALLHVHLSARRRRAARPRAHSH